MRFIAQDHDPSAISRIKHNSPTLNDLLLPRYDIKLVKHSCDSSLVPAPQIAMRAW